MENRSFGVEDIRRIREEDDARYRGMTPEEISRDIREGASVGLQIIEDIKLERAGRQAM